MNNTDNIEVRWSGKYPCLCSGEWQIKVNNIKFDIPNDKISESMNTKGDYHCWHFTNNYEEECETYTDGLDFEDWIKENDWLLQEIINKFPNCKDKMKLAKKIYTFISKYDFRPGSCGGCI